VEKFGGTSSTNDYSEPDAMPLSSAAMVTAAKTVQKIESSASANLFLE
jgi:hypothetical protein